MRWQHTVHHEVIWRCWETGHGAVIQHRRSFSLRLPSTTTTTSELRLITTRLLFVPNLLAQHGSSRITREPALPDHDVRHKVILQSSALRSQSLTGVKDHSTNLFVQAKNVILNVSEMEAKVREATNEDPWYAHLKLSICCISPLCS